MASINIVLHRHEGTPVATVMTCADGQKFISLAVTNDVSVALLGFDAESQASARALAAALLQAADDMGTFAPAAPDPTVDALTQLEALGAGDAL